MAENQHNDNLERFFKANLERYSPTPSSDFWERMEGSIPARPSFWQRWGKSVYKWAGLGLLLMALATIALLWQNDRREMAKLSEKLAVQQQQLAQLKEKNKAYSTAPSSNVTTKNPATSPTSTRPAQIGSPSSAIAASSVITPNNHQTTKVGAKPIPPSSKANTVISIQPIGKENALATKLENIDNQSLAMETAVVQPLKDAQGTTQSVAVETVIALAENKLEAADRMVVPDLALLGFMESSQVYSLKNRIPNVRYRIKQSWKSAYPRFSMQVGVSTFIMPLGRLFTEDTLYSGKVRPSICTGLLMNYDLSPSWSFQGGYQYKDIRAARLSLQYNSFPVSLRKKWAWSRRGYLEAKTGLAVNSLLNARTANDGLGAKGLRNTWLGLEGSVNLSLPMTDELTLLAGPTFGFSVTPIANQKRSWEAGLGLSLRYEF